MYPVIEQQQILTPLLMKCFILVNSFKFLQHLKRNGFIRSHHYRLVASPYITPDVRKKT